MTFELKYLFQRIPHCQVQYYNAFYTIEKYYTRFRIIYLADPRREKST